MPILRARAGRTCPFSRLSRGTCPFTRPFRGTCPLFALPPRGHAHSSRRGLGTLALCPLAGSSIEHVPGALNGPDRAGKRPGDLPIHAAVPRDMRCSPAAPGHARYGGAGHVGIIIRRLQHWHVRVNAPGPGTGTDSSRRRTAGTARLMPSAGPQWAVPGQDEPAVHLAVRPVPARSRPVRRLRRAIKLSHARPAQTRASPGHVAAVRLRNPASVVGSPVQPDQPAVSGPVRRRACSRRTGAARSPSGTTPPLTPPSWWPRKLRRSGRCSGSASSMRRRAVDSPGCIRRRMNGTRVSRESPPPSRRRLRPPLPRPSASYRWKCVFV